MENHKTFYDRDEALACQAEHPSSEITHKPGHPIMLGNRLIYEIPEARPSWTVWWEEE